MKKPIALMMTNEQLSLCEELRDEYEEYVGLMRDSIHHKRILLTDDDCFLEWAAEKLNIDYEQGAV